MVGALQFGMRAGGVPQLAAWNLPPDGADRAG